MTRRQAFRTAKKRAGVPCSQQPTRQWIVGDEPNRAGQKNYRYSREEATHGRYYEYNMPQGTRVIVEHTNDSNHLHPHFHAGQPKVDPSRRGVDFQVERYQQVGGRHHIYYRRG